MTRLVSQLLKAKGSEVWSVAPDTRVFDALKVMSDRNCGSLVVLEEQQLVGIFSERDYARKIILMGKSSRETVVGEIMSSDVVVIRPDQSIDECMALMTRERIRHVPVVRDGNLIGLVSIGDVVKALVDDQQFTIRQLEGYITGQAG